MHAGFCIANCACVGAELQQRADSARITHGAAFAALIIGNKTLSLTPSNPPALAASIVLAAAAP